MFGALSGLSLSAYEPGEVLLGAGMVKFGMTNVGITSSGTIKTAVTRTVVNAGVANLTQVTMSRLAGTPLGTANLYDANVGRSYQSVGVIQQTPLWVGAVGVAAGVCGLIPFMGKGLAYRSLYRVAVELRAGRGGRFNIFRAGTALEALMFFCGEWTGAPGSRMFAF